MAQNYQITQKIGEGAFSDVFLAYHTKSNFPVALKKIRLSDFDSRYSQLCLNEIHLLKSVQSPNVIAFFEAFLTENHLYISLEFADDGDLTYKIDEHRHRGTLFSEKIIWSYMHQITKGLKDLHDSRILHRDLKPANIFLTSKGTCKIGDLGLSRIFSQKTMQAKTNVGTEYYMAPERKSFGGYHFRSDIWSLGCILYELCNLRSPFYGEQKNIFSLNKRISTVQLIPLTSNRYSPKLRRFLTSCLSRLPHNRPDARQAHYIAVKMNKRFRQLEEEHKKKFGHFSI